MLFRLFRFESNIHSRNTVMFIDNVIQIIRFDKVISILEYILLCVVTMLFRLFRFKSDIYSRITVLFRDNVFIMAQCNYYLRLNIEKSETVGH